MGECVVEIMGCVWITIKWFVDLIDKHQGACMVFLTAALVWFAYKSAKIALKNLEMIKRNDDKRSQPYVTLEVVNDMPFYGVRMVNLGATSAHNVVVVSEPRIEMLFPNYRKPIKFLHEPVAYLAPSARFETDIGSFRDIEKGNPVKVYSGTISFENDDGEKFVHEFVLDFSPFTDAIHKDVKTVHNVAQQLEDIKKELVNIGSGYHKPHVLVEGHEARQGRVDERLEKSRMEADSQGEETNEGETSK